MTATTDSGPDGPDPISDDLDIDAERPVRSGLSARSRPGSPGRPPLKILLVVGALVLVAGAALAWRSHHRGRVVAQGLARADALLRADTAASRREAERLLEPLVELDPVRAGALRGLALALIALDDGDPEAAARAEAILVAPGRASQVPPEADLAYGALALSRREAGTALSYAARATESPWAAALQARVALLAGKVDVAREPLDRAVAFDASFPAVQALRGDVLRRSGHAAQAREAYAAALAASPGHARASYGMAKLALAGGAPADAARAPLARLLDDPATPGPDRARAAYHLASLEARAGQSSAASATLQRSGTDGAARGWLEAAVAEQAQAAGYRFVAGAPAAVTSASDDDPPPPTPKAPPSTSVSPTFRIPEAPPPAPARRPSGAKPPAPAKKATAKATPSAAKGKQAAKATAKKGATAKAGARPKAKPSPKKQAAAKPAKSKGARKSPSPATATADEPDALDAALSKVRASKATQAR